MRAPVLLLLALAAACGGTTNVGDGGADGAADGSKNPCDGLGCAVGVGTLTIKALDAQSMMPVAATFTEGATKLVGTCSADAGGVCAAWQFPNLSIGAHTITVQAPGYKDASLAVTMSGPSGCCGRGPDVDKTVLMTSTDPAALCTSTGGTVSTGSCCQGTNDFPDLCTTGPCGCGPQSSHMVQICSCSGGKCFKPNVGCQ